MLARFRTTKHVFISLLVLAAVLALSTGVAFARQAATAPAGEPVRGSHTAVVVSHLESSSDHGVELAASRIQKNQSRLSAGRRGAAFHERLAANVLMAPSMVRRRRQGVRGGATVTARRFDGWPGGEACSMAAPRFQVPARGSTGGSGTAVRRQPVGPGATPDLVLAAPGDGQQHRAGGGV